MKNCCLQELLDSVSAMDLVMAIKQKFDVDLPFEQLVDILANSANIIQYVEIITKAKSWNN